jgi:prevent-host-death family protein
MRVQRVWEALGEMTTQTISEQSTGGAIRKKGQPEWATADQFALINKYDHGTMTMISELKMKKMAAGSFKIHCLAVMDEVRAKREAVVITKHGKPVAKLVPADKNTNDVYNFLAGKGAIAGDIVSPAISDEDWGELK